MYFLQCPLSIDTPAHDPHSAGLCLVAGRPGHNAHWENISGLVCLGHTYSALIAVPVPSFL